jgi:hypothetical protein
MQRGTHPAPGIVVRLDVPAVASENEGAAGAAAWRGVCHDDDDYRQQTATCSAQ